MRFLAVSVCAAICASLGGLTSAGAQDRSEATRPVSPDPWALMAERDLRALYDLLAQNHPGPVDPENTLYRERLNEGLETALAEAATVRDYGPYKHVLQRYANSFRDGHIAVSFPVVDRYVWPRFLLRQDGSGTFRVGMASEGSPVSVGDRVVSCDGASAASLMTSRVNPRFLNADLPHLQHIYAPQLLLSDVREPNRLRECVFSTGEGEKTVQLEWVTISGPDSRRHVRDVLGAGAPELGIRQIGDVWLVSLPTFNFNSQTEVERIRGLIDELKNNAQEMRAGRVVFDVRANAGGNSAWGQEVASTFWSPEMVERISLGFDNTVDWRVSASNITYLETVAIRNREAGFAEGADSWQGMANQMRAALARNETLMRVERRPVTPVDEAPANPVSGRVFLLTDNACFSACLDFADILRRMPGVTHVGLPTAADAVYIDNTSGTLPSGLANVSYSLKVYRNRVRGHNEWYDPHVRWPGGAMTDEAVATWIAALP